jgi:ABC-2 type transport system ATP-binding protein
MYCLSLDSITYHLSLTFLPSAGCRLPSLLSFFICHFSFNTMSVIQLNKVTKKFGSNTALEDVTYSVEPGTVFALLGENGAGKTTTIRILLGLCDPDTGHSTVLGLDSKKDDLAVRRQVGYVPEQPMLYDWMTVEEIGRFAASFYADGFWKEYCRLTESFELPLKTKIKSLSKGMRAKVSLSLALAHDPELLILDEPTSGLDPLVRRSFLESMVDRAASGKTVFLSSHQIGEVERVADTIAIMKKSKIVLIEKLEELKSSASVITATLSENARWLSDGTPDFSAPMEQVVQMQTDNREVRVLGRYLDPNAANVLDNDQSVGHFEIRTPSLEEIFVAYMKN